MYHLRRSWKTCLVFAFSLTVPLAMRAEAISVNSVCEVGDCVSPDSLSNGQSTSGTFNVNFTFGDGDTYNISGSYGASYSTVNGSTISINPIVTYTGAGPSAGTDTIQLSALQNYFDPSCCTWAGTYTESVPLAAAGGSFGAGSQMSGQVFYDNVGVGLVGPFAAPGSYSQTKSANLDFGPLDTSDTLDADFVFDFTFGQGTLTGAAEGASSAAPEPASFVLCGLGLLALGRGVYRRKRSTFEQPGSEQ
jgi:hypothetical protein